MIAAAAVTLTIAGHSDARAQPRVRVDGAVRALSFSADGKWLAVGHNPGGLAGMVTVFSTKSRRARPIELPRNGKPLRWAAFLDNGKLVAALDEDRLLIVWLVAEQREVFRKNLPKDFGETKLIRVMGDPSGPYVAWAVSPKGGGYGEVQVARIPGGQVVSSWNKVAVGQQAEWSASGSHLLVGGAAWNWDTFESWRPRSNAVSAMSADGTKVVSSEKKKCDDLGIVEFSSGKVLRTITAAEGCPRQLWFVNKDRDLLWIAQIGNGESRGYHLYKWDSRKDRIRPVKKDLAKPVASALSVDGKLLALTDGTAVQFIWVK